MLFEIKDSYAAKQNWHKWFAWFPVKVASYTKNGVLYKRYAWMQKVWRQGISGWDGLVFRHCLEKPE